MRGLRRTLRARPSEVELQEHSSESPRQKAMASHGNANTHRKTFCALYILVALLGVIAILAGVLAVVSVLRLLALETRINNLATLVQTPNLSGTFSNSNPPIVVRDNKPIETEGEKCISECMTVIDDVTKNNRQIQDFISRSSSLNRELNRFRTMPFPYNGYMYTLTNTPLTWSEAREECQTFGADLAVFGVRNYATRLTLASAFSINEVWVGISDQDQEGVWTWLDGSRATPNEIRWGDNQPDNTDNQEHCGELWPITLLYRMNDEPCTKEQIGLCELRFNG